MKNFTIKLTVLAVALGLAGVAVFFWAPALPISPAFPYILLFLYLSTLFIFLALARSMSKRTSRFANAVMLVNFGKLLFYVLIIIVYAYLNRSDAVYCSGAKEQRLSEGRLARPGVSNEGNIADLCGREDFHRRTPCYAGC